MPEDVHLLIWPTTRDYAMSAILMSIKQSVARRAVTGVKRQAPAFLPNIKDAQPNGKRHYRFWQRSGGHDRNIVEPAAAWAQIDYYHANPVRRGLCGRPEDWAWSSAREYVDPGSGPLRIDFECLPRTRQG